MITENLKMTLYVLENWGMIPLVGDVVIQRIASEVIKGLTESIRLALKAEGIKGSLTIEHTRRVERKPVTNFEAAPELNGRKLPAVIMDISINIDIKNEDEAFDKKVPLGEFIRLIPFVDSKGFMEMGIRNGLLLSLWQSSAKEISTALRAAGFRNAVTVTLPDSVTVQYANQV